MKKSEVVNAVLELVQDKSGPMEALVSRWVEIVLDDIAAHGHLASLEREEVTPLAQSQRDYELQENTEKVYTVFVPAWGDPEGRLKKLSQEDFLTKMLEDGVTVEGRPQYYSIFADNALRVHPLADSTNAPSAPTDNEKLHIYKRAEMSTLSLGDDIREIKRSHIPTIIMGAYAFGAVFDSLVDSTNAYLKYQNMLKFIFRNEATDYDRATATRYNALQCLEFRHSSTTTSVAVLIHATGHWGLDQKSCICLKTWSLRMTASGFKVVGARRC